VFERVPQVLINARVSNSKKYAYLDDPVIRAECDRIEGEFKGAGRVLIRPSGTEPLVRVMIEAGDKSRIEDEAKALAALIEERLDTDG
jgi:phosphoglucosamine mutase